MSNVHAVDFRLRSETATANKASTTATAKAVARDNTQHDGEAKAMKGAIWGAALSGLLVGLFIYFGVFGVWENPNVDYDAPAEQIVQQR